LAPRAQFAWTVSFPRLDWADPLNISENRLVNPPSPGGLLVLWARPYAGLYVPATYTLWSAEAALAAETPTGGDPHPLDARVFHFGNVLLHAANAWLVWLLLVRIVRSPWGAAAGALLFALHPLQVESACWVTETKGLLCGCFGFWALLIFERFVGQWSARRSPGQSAKPRRAALVFLYAGAAALFLLAMLAKPAAVALPLVAWLIATWTARETANSPGGVRIAAALVPWLALALGVALVTRNVQGAESFVQPTIWWQRPVVAADAVAFYLYKLVIPLNLAPDYGRSPDWLLASNWVWITWLLPVALAVALCLRRVPPVWRRAGWISLGLLLPVLGLVPFAFQRFSTVADRYAYLAMLGPAIVVAAFAGRTRRRAAHIAIAALLLLCGVRSAAQTRHWRSNAALFAQAVSVNPTSTVALNGLGNVHSRQEEWNLALDFYRRAVTADPNNASSYFNLGRAELALDRPQRAIESFARALELRPGYHKVREPYALALVAVQRVDDAGAQLLALVAAEPDNAVAWENLGRIRAFQGRRAEAIEHLEHALEINPRLESARQELQRLTTGPSATPP
ncbi:MAG: tetratricopeptide repeat protein, partial [Pirellulales bacterium]